MASFLWRNDDLRRLRTRNLVLQGADGSYPASDGLLRFVDAEGTVGASGIFVDDSGNLVVTGSADISGGLTVGGPVDISGYLVVSGDADICGNLTVGSMTIDTLVLDSLSVTGSVDISGGLTVGGSTDLSGNLRVTGNVGITHNSTTAAENYFNRTFNDPCGGHFLSTTDFVVGQNDTGFGGIGSYRDYRYVYGSNISGGNRTVWGIVNDASGGNPGNVEFYQAVCVSAKNNSDPNSAITIGGTRGRSMHRVFPGTTYNALVTEVASGVGNVGYKLDAQYYDSGDLLTYGADLLLNSDTGVAGGLPGNVGIGTTSPSTKLHVSGGDVLVEDASYAEISCRGTVILDGSSQIPAGDDVTVGRVNIGTQSFGTSVSTTIPASGAPRYTDRCRMDLCTPLGFGGLNQIQAPRLSIMPFSGNVGIGTTEPQALLDVSGDMRITGDIINPTGWINPVGSITMYGGSSAPNGWFLCDGGAISRTTYNRLFTVIGTTFGNGDGVSTFNLPNLTNRFPANYGALGATGGSATATLATANLPAHTHTVTSLPTTSNGDHNHTFTVNITESSNSNGDSGNPKWGSGNNNNGTPAYYGTTDNAGSHTHTVSGTTDSTGSGSSFSILPPYISLNFIIKY